MNSQINQHLLTDTELVAWTGLRRRGVLEQWMFEKRIPVVFGKGGQICTTLDAINHVLVGIECNVENEKWDFDHGTTP